MKQRTVIFIGGFIWLLVGIFLLTLGLNFILKGTVDPSKFSILSLFRFTTPQNAPFFVITLFLWIGFLKGKYVLGKSVIRQVKRVKALAEPISLKDLYSKGYYLLMASMILLGLSMRYIPISVDTRGAIDVAIGAALIQGAALYFRTLSSPSQVLRK